MWLLIRGAIYFLGKQIVLEYLPKIIAAGVFIVALVVSTIIWALAVIAQPGGIYWLASQAPPEIQAKHPLVPIAGGVFDPGAIGSIGGRPVIAVGNITDIERYGLARAVGFSPDESITATAISIAEDGSGNPSAISGRNDNGTYDFGLWQINSGWWPRFGGRDALAIPINNAKAAFVIYHLQGWCAWSTYGTPTTCGGGHNDSYRANLGRAHAAAQEVEQNIGNPSRANDVGANI